MEQGVVPSPPPILSTRANPLRWNILLAYCSVCGVKHINKQSSPPSLITTCRHSTDR